MRRSAAETSYRDAVTWEQRGLCADDPAGWDLDVVGIGTPEAKQAQQWCLTDCPVLAECRSRTDQLIDARMPPQALIQAGTVYPAKGWKTGKRLKSQCNRGHARTPDNLYANGMCIKCAKRRRRPKRVAS